MTRSTPLIKWIAAALVALATAGIAQAQTERLDALFEELQEPDLENWQHVEEQIWAEWSRSGSPSMDLLLDRGREAMEAGDTTAAIEHFTALTDHAPDFAEGYNARATAYFQADMYGPSLRDIETALALNPRHFGAMSGLAMILERLEFDAEALSAYRAVNAIHPHRPDIKEAIERLETGRGGAEL